MDKTDTALILMLFSLLFMTNYDITSDLIMLFGAGASLVFAGVLVLQDRIRAFPEDKPPSADDLENGDIE